MKKINKYVIREVKFNNVNIIVFENEIEWKKEIDEIAVDSIHRGTFSVEVYEVPENTEEEKETEKVIIFGTQGRKDRSVYVDIIPEEWGEPIFTQEIKYFEILENEEGKYYISTDYNNELYDDKEELIDIEFPSQYINF